MGNLETLSQTFDYPPEVLASLRACVTARNVRALQVPVLLKASCRHLDVLQQRLASLCQDDSVDQELAHAASRLQLGLHTGNGFTVEKMASDLGDLLTMPAMVGASIWATVQECQALAAAAMQNYQAAAALCFEAVEIPGLAVAQQWHLAHCHAVWLGDHGREFDDEAALQKAIDFLRTRVLTLARECGEAGPEASTFETLGNILGVLGQRRMGTRYLEEAIDAFREALAHRDPETAATAWANAQNGLGNALGVLGQRQSDDGLCQQAIVAFERALEFRTEEHTPDDWASTLNNLAAVLQSLGRKNKDPKILKRAVESYRSVLRVWTRARVPMDWAATMYNLGTALSALGDHRRGPRTLEQAVAAYHSALAERPRDHLPEEWAMTYNNLGTALQKLAEREQSVALMQKATEAYENTLAEWSREKAPMTWAMTMANLGVARCQLAAMKEDIETADWAVGEIQSAVDVFRGASHAQYTELGEEQLSLARQLLATLVAKADPDHTEAVRLTMKINS